MQVFFIDKVVKIVRTKRYVGVEFMEEKGSFLTGLFWGTSLSTVLWVSFFGWIKLLIQIL
jgi:hypothetical protein